MRINFNTIVYALLIIGVVSSCNDNSDELPATVKQPGMFTITGDPRSASGAKWTYHEDGKIVFDLQGVLFAPTGIGRFPAVLISHGTGGNASSYSTAMAKVAVSWGYVCIATNYTHAGNVPCGSPGLCDESSGTWGASEENILRGIKCRNLLASLDFVDSTRIVAFGHSRGAFITTALAGSYPDRFKAFAHTAGGLSDAQNSSAPESILCNRINKPYLMHHGDNDNVVNIGMDRSLSNLLNKNSIINVLYTYPGYTHEQIVKDELMFERTKAWFNTYNP